MDRIRWHGRRDRMKEKTEDAEKYEWQRQKIDNGIFVTGWILAVLAVLFYMTVRVGILPLQRYAVPCLFHRMTGFYCPGCGGTRSFFSLCRGDIWTSFQYYPLVPCTAVWGGCFLLSHTIEKISRKRICIGIHFRGVYLWIALAVVVLNCVLKNLILVIWHIDLLTIL